MILHKLAVLVDRPVIPVAQINITGLSTSCALTAIFRHVDVTVGRGTDWCITPGAISRDIRALVRLKVGSINDTPLSVICRARDTYAYAF